MKCIFFHDWEKWEWVDDADGNTQVTKIFLREGDEIPYDFYVRQERECKKCGLSQIKKVNL